MKVLRYILCPVDFSSASRRAFDYAVRLATTHEAALHLLHVVSPLITAAHQNIPSPIGPPLGEGARHPATELRELAEQRIEEWASPARTSGIRVTTEVRSGEIQKILRTEARDLVPDILVMGTHNRHGIEHLTLGSVTEQEARAGVAPVLSVPDSEPESFRLPPEVGRLLVATDFSGVTSAAIDCALALSRGARGEVRLLHVVRDPKDAGESLARAGVFLDAYRDKLGGGGGEPVFIPEVEIGKVHERILEVARRSGSDAIVLGVSDRGLLKRLMFGETTEHVLEDAKRPVLVVPAN